MDELKSPELVSREMAHLFSNYVAVMTVMERRLRGNKDNNPETKQILDKMSERNMEFFQKFRQLREELPVSKIPPLRILVVEDDVDLIRDLVECLEMANHEVVGSCGSGHEMVKMALELKPDLIFFDIHLPGINGLKALREIHKQSVIPAIAITGDTDVSLVETAMQEYILGFLVKPAHPTQILSAIHLAWSRWSQYQIIAKEKDNLEKKLEQRKFVERAKGKLQLQYGCSEDTAFRAIQRSAKQHNKTLGEIAQMIISGQNVVKIETTR